MGRYLLGFWADTKCFVMLDGFWEIWLTQFLARLITPGMTVVDVGANFGYYTLLFGDIVGNNGRVIAIEPNPNAVSLLKETVQLNGFASRTQIVECALGQHTGTTLLYAPDGEPKNATVVGQTGLPDGPTIEVPAVTLDELAQRLGRIDVVKIDAEGSEPAIVAGMKELIARDRPAIIMEFNAARYPEPKAFLEILLESYGTFREITFDGTLRPVDASVVTNQRLIEDRLLFFR
jgi:FkbM family methyltransferase